MHTDDVPLKTTYCRRLAVFLGVLFATASVATYVVPVSAQVSASDILAHRQELEQQLADIEKQIVAQQELLVGKQRERVSLERDVAILDAQIQKAKLDIRARDLVIKQLNSDIGSKVSTIGQLNDKLSREKASLAQLIRRTNEIDDYTMVEVVLGNQSFSDFFEDLDAFDSIQKSLDESFYEIEVTKTDTNTQKELLEDRRADQLELRKLQVLQQKEIEKQENAKREILNATRGEEAKYQAFIQEKEKSAAEIRSQLFALRDSAAIPFAEALELAQFASEKTGIRPAFLLGILSQETNLGENVGTGTWTSDMHPTRDRPVFQYVTQQLGLDPNLMPVSAKPSYGWGGAMGPAQFIPSTWVCYGGFINTKTGDCSNSTRSLSWNAFWQGPWAYSASQDRVRKLTGKSSPSSPWDNRDAFMASALLLRDNGGAGGNRADERLAALRYFAGWTNAKNPAYGFYGDGVMELADKWQHDIDVLANSVARN